jgi:site-specific recombinase XerC
LDESEASPLPLGSLLLPKNAGVFLSVGSGPLAKEAQEVMGHADIRTTLNIYAKVSWTGFRGVCDCCFPRSYY